MTNDTWNPRQYDLYKSERQQPFFDLASLIEPAESMQRAVDLGCGTGELTRLLHQRLALAETCGIDRSSAMLAKAHILEGGGLSFTAGQLETWHDPAGVDLLFSNAALQWVPGHRELLPHLLQSLRPGGQIAVQVPANHDHVSHRLAAEIATEEPFCTALGGYVRISPVLAAEDYATLLYRLGLRDIVCFTKVYAHGLSSPRDVVEWVKGTLLTAYETRLSTPLFAQFLARYQERLLATLGDEQPYFYAFKRTLFKAVKKVTT